MKVAPIPAEALQSVKGLDTPKYFYRVLRSPAPLAGMSFPHQVPWKSIATAGFESIVCLTHNTAPYDPSPLRVLRAVKFKDLLGGQQPDNPQQEQAKLGDIVRVVSGELRSGRGVVVHCMGGTGRTGTVIACVLAALGLPATEVMKYMSTVNVARGKSPGWPESDWQQAQVASFVAKSAQLMGADSPNTWLQPTAVDLAASLAAPTASSLRSAAAEPKR